MSRGRSASSKIRGIGGRIDWFRTLSLSQSFPVDESDIRYRPSGGESGQLLLILLDSSGSTLKGQGLSIAKGIVASVIESAYLRRSRVGVIQFAGKGAFLSAPPRRAPKRSPELINNIAGGGGTPLRHGLEEASRVLRLERRRFPKERQVLVLLTDGRSRDSVHDIELPCRTLIVDTETGPVRLGRCRQLTEILGGDYMSFDELPIKLTS